MAANSPPGRTPGKYVVWGIGTFLGIFLVIMIAIAMSIAPAAERFKASRTNPTSLRP